MKLLKIEEYDREIQRIQNIIKKTKNYKTKRDHIKCLKRLKDERAEYLLNRMKE